MFSDSLFNAKMTLLSSIRPNIAYPDIYDPDIVINMLVHINVLILLSDMQEPGVIMSDTRKDELLEIARVNANHEYAMRMSGDYGSDSDS